MTPSTLLAHLWHVGIHLRVEGGTLYAGPRSLLTDDYRRAITRHKDALAALLVPTPGVRPRDLLVRMYTEARR